MPIDIIGGNSMGAYVSSVYATGYAKGWDIKTMINATRKIFSRWHYHLTPPVTSIFADGIPVHARKECVGDDTQIEDLWLPFFCVSSNLTRAEVKTHRTGALWKAVRVSGGLPAVVPPVVFDGDLHVDGALLNNLPIDVMSQMCDGGTVIAAGWSTIGYGNRILIDHGNGFQTLYAHLNSIWVASGQVVYKGAPIGGVGSTGNSSGPHLHFEIRYNYNLLDPLAYLYR